MSEYEALRGDLHDLGMAMDRYAGTVNSRGLAVDEQIARLWDGQAELRDEINAVANRVESLTRAVMADPAEVAQAIVNDANRSVLRTVANPEGMERLPPALCTSPTCAFRADEHYHQDAGSVVFV